MKNYKVYLNIYHFLSIGKCLQAIGVGAYHTGIEIGPSQYCYSVCSTDPKDSGILEFQPETADYIFCRKIYLGEVTIMNYRLNQIIQQLAQEYTCGKYHMLSNNCNHFSNDLAKRLTNAQIPKYIFRATNLLGYLCCCLPNRWMNGQEALKSLIEEEEEMERRRQTLLTKGQQ